MYAMRHTRLLHSPLQSAEEVRNRLERVHKTVEKVVRFHLHAVVHFSVWLELEDYDLKEIDEDTLVSFERHRSTCSCPGTSRNRARRVLSCIHRFLEHLRQRGVMQSVEAPAQPVRLVEDFLQWMKVHRGVVDTMLTLERRRARAATLPHTHRLCSAASHEHTAARRLGMAGETSTRRGEATVASTVTGHDKDV